MAGQRSCAIRAPPNQGLGAIDHATKVSGYVLSAPPQLQNYCKYCSHFKQSAVVPPLCIFHYDATSLSVKPMKTLASLIAAALISFNVAAESLQDLTPEEFMHYYVRVFNEENLPALQSAYHFPHVKIRSGQLVLFDDSMKPAVDFAAIKRTGWRYSRIHHVRVLAANTQSAMVEMRFSRFDAADKEILSQTSFYQLTKRSGFWQIISLHDMGIGVSETRVK